MVESPAEQNGRQEFERWQTCRKAVLKSIPESDMRKDVQGHIPCPLCSTGTIVFSRAGSFNGHIHGRCSTSGCIQWME